MDSQLWPGFQPFLGDRILTVRRGESLAGALAWRSIVEDEREILYLETAPAFRRQGIASELLTQLLGDWQGTTFLEVRESNEAAVRLYLKFGFTAVGRRDGYYTNPDEAALVLKFSS